MHGSVRMTCAAAVLVLPAGRAISPVGAAPQDTITVAFSAGFKEDVLETNINNIMAK
jgi:hypothetical protein